MKNYDELRKTNALIVDYRRIQFNFYNECYRVDATDCVFSVRLKKTYPGKYDEWIFLGSFLDDIESCKTQIINRALNLINECASDYE